MRNGSYAKSMMIVCAVAGCLAGFGIDRLLDGTQQKNNAKDNTLLREEYDGVFFSGESQEVEEESGVEIITGVPVPTITSTQDDAPAQTQVITYPAEIFGQTPVVDRTDGQVTYFEFALDLIELLEGEIQQKKLSETALFSKFMLKALFCGIEITDLNINAPIPRAQAALAIYLAAGIMDKPGTGTDARSAAKYVTDINGCSSAEKKAIAYLYEQGIEDGYAASGQGFLPEEGLKETDETVWKGRLTECWN